MKSSLDSVNRKLLAMNRGCRLGPPSPGAREPGLQERPLLLLLRFALVLGRMGHVFQVVLLVLRGFPGTGISGTGISRGRDTYFRNLLIGPPARQVESPWRLAKPDKSPDLSRRPITAPGPD